jgi:hypothetical protein
MATLVLDPVHRFDVAEDFGSAVISLSLSA